jgi:hypothetical protein
MLGELCASIGSRQLWTDQIFVVRLAMAPLRWLTATSLQIADCSLLRVTHDSWVTRQRRQEQLARGRGGEGLGFGVLRQPCVCRKCIPYAHAAMRPVCV